MRPRTSDNQTQHGAFLAEYPVDSPEYQATIAWFKTLPLWLDLGDLRVVHACWDRELIRRVSETFDGSRLTDALLHRANPGRSLRDSHWEFRALETLLKGKEIPLPDGSHFLDRYGKKRHHIRIKWWDRQGTTYREKFLGAPDFETHIPDDEISGDHGIDYGHHEPPVFLGHYWLQGAPTPLESNVACLDYSVARSGGKLVAYRWNGEKTLRSDSFVWVERMEPEPQSTTG